WRVGVLRVARRSRALRSDEHHVRDYRTDAGASRGEQEGAHGRARACGPRKLGRSDPGLQSPDPRRLRAWSPKSGDSSPPVIKEHLKQFLDHLRYNRNVSPHTLRAYDSDLTQYVAFLTTHFGRPASAIDPREIDSQAVRGFLEALHRKGASRASVA